MFRRIFIGGMGIQFMLLFLFLTMGCDSAKTQEIAVPDTVKVQPEKVTLLFVGDLMQHQGQIDAARTAQGYDYSSCFEYVKEEISGADFAIGNLEVTLGGKPYKGYPAFSAPDEYLTAIRDAGFDVLLTANNHCLDRRKKGLERTLRLLDSLNISRAGTYATPEERKERYPLLLEKKGMRIALLNYTYGTNGISVMPPNVVNYIDTIIIQKDIEACRKMKSDVIIACMHWGIEYQSLPNGEQKRLTDWLLLKGVDHVIGSHPHVVQPLEVRRDSVKDKRNLVVYSLGNYISNMSMRRTDGGLMVKMELVKDSVAWLSKCAYSLVWTARPKFSGKKNHQVYPVNIEIDSLSQSARCLLKTFIKDARELFKKHNFNIEEYTFYEKKR